MGGLAEVGPRGRCCPRCSARTGAPVSQRQRRLEDGASSPIAGAVLDGTGRPVAGAAGFTAPAAAQGLCQQLLAGAAPEARVTSLQGSGKWVAWKVGAAQSRSGQARQHAPGTGIPAFAQRNAHVLTFDVDVDVDVDIDLDLGRDR